MNKEELPKCYCDKYFAEKWGLHNNGCQYAIAYNDIISKPKFKRVKIKGIIKSVTKWIPKINL